ncbi:MAG: GNAT family N-acetyltransferase [Bauldia sp.]|nr:GNAT family N-acetyltransferase [Bauldia sp.]
MTGFVVDALSGDHDRAGFSCGVDALDKYLQSQAGQDARRRIANCFVALAAGSKAVAGYYTLSATSIATPDLPETITRRLPRYPLVPAVLIGRLAVDQRYGGRGLGAALLFDAIRRCAAADAAVFAVVVDAKDERSVRFYEHHGFIRFGSRPLSLYLPMATAIALLGVDRSS